MAIDVSCEGCGKDYRVKDELAGRRIKCKECGEAITIPDESAEEYVEEAEEEFEEPARKRSGRRSGQKAKSGRGASSSSTLGDVFATNAIWLKMLGGAVATPILIVLVALRASRRGQAMDLTSPIMVMALIGAIPAGAVIGALFTVKEVVEQRLQTGAPVALPFVLLFGKGFVSALLWVPLVIVVVLVVTIATL